MYFFFNLDSSHEIQIMLAIWNHRKLDAIPNKSWPTQLYASLRKNSLVLAWPRPELGNHSAPYLLLLTGGNSQTISSRYLLKLCPLW